MTEPVQEIFPVSDMPEGLPESWARELIALRQIVEVMHRRKLGARAAMRILCYLIKMYGDEV